MKPIVTWVVLANAREVSVLVNRGPGKGLVPVSGKGWSSEDADSPRDKAGVGHSIAGHGVSAVDQADPQAMINARFAEDVSQHLLKALTSKEFDRLIIVAAPRMLGLLRASLDHVVQAVVIGEIDKDLSDQPVDAITSHIGEFIAA